MEFLELAFLNLSMKFFKIPYPLNVLGIFSSETFYLLQKHSILFKLTGFSDETLNLFKHIHYLIPLVTIFNQRRTGKTD